MNNQRWLLWLSALLFIGAMFAPAMISGNDVSFGYEVLVIGWLGVPGLMLAWLANIFGPLALIFAATRWYKTALVLSVLALCVGLQSFTFTTMPTTGPGSGNPVSLGIGFYIWELSFLFTVIYSYMQIRGGEVAE